MTRSYEKNLDTVVPPTEQQVQAVGQNLLANIRRHIINDKLRFWGTDDPMGLLSKEPVAEASRVVFDGKEFGSAQPFHIWLPQPEEGDFLNDEANWPWEFDIEGSAALIDDEGFTRDSTFKAFRHEDADTESTREFRLLSTRSNGDDKKIDIYQIGFLKNTEWVISLARATVTPELIREFEEEQAERFEEWRRASLEGETPGDFCYVESHVEDSLRDNSETQLKFFPCNQAQTVELLEILQRALPLDMERHIQIYDPNEHGDF